MKAGVFWPPFLLLSFSLGFSLIKPDLFLELVQQVNQWILHHFDSGFNLTSFFLLLLCLIVWVSPLAKVRIGGAEAKPFLNRWRWFAIVLCTTIAVGILFWGVAEPIFHLNLALTGAAEGPEAKHSIILSTVFTHWSFTPYAIYTVPALCFALAYYNRSKAFSLSSMFIGLFDRSRSWIQILIDTICLFSLAAGMAAVLGAGILILSGGFTHWFGVESSTFLLLGITVLIIVTFSISASTGLLRGIRLLSTFNLIVFVIIACIIFILGPTKEIMQSAVSGVSGMFQNYLPQSLGFGKYSNVDWMHSWTTFYWANWMAWAPITALFLGKLAYGYTVREFMLMNWLLPSIFGILWMSIFSGTALFIESESPGHLASPLLEAGPESLIYILFEYLQISDWMTPLFLLTVFISYVTAADSNTDAMSSLSSHGVSPENPTAPSYIKFIWAIVVGSIAFIMIQTSGIDGVKTLSNLGGLPSLFVLLLAGVSLLVLMFRPSIVKKK